MNSIQLPRSFYEDMSTSVAQKLLGKKLIRHFENVVISGIIVETEAYLSQNDPASHNFVGKTSRNAVLYGEAGHAYIHSMRQYHLIDIVTEAIGMPGSVLVRALQPVDGIMGMNEARRTDDPLKLTSGPSRLCQALHIDRSLNGQDVTDPYSPLVIVGSGLHFTPDSIETTTRIGISKAADSLLRFYIKGNPYVSRK